MNYGTSNEIAEKKQPTQSELNLLLSSLKNQYSNLSDSFQLLREQIVRLDSICNRLEPTLFPKNFPHSESSFSGSINNQTLQKPPRDGLMGSFDSAIETNNGIYKQISNEFIPDLITCIEFLEKHI